MKGVRPFLSYDELRDDEKALMKAPRTISVSFSTTTSSLYKTKGTLARMSIPFHWTQLLGISPENNKLYAELDEKNKTITLKVLPKEDA